MEWLTLTLLYLLHINYGKPSVKTGQHLVNIKNVNVNCRSDGRWPSVSCIKVGHATHLSTPPTSNGLLSTTLHKGYTPSCTGTELWHWAYILRFLGNFPTTSSYVSLSWENSPYYSLSRASGRSEMWQEGSLKGCPYGLQLIFRVQLTHTLSRLHFLVRTLLKLTRWCLLWGS